VYPGLATLCLTAVSVRAGALPCLCVEPHCDAVPDCSISEGCCDLSDSVLSHTVTLCLTALSVRAGALAQVSVFVIWGSPQSLPPAAGACPLLQVEGKQAQIGRQLPL
jgi:hypothetical protein